MLASTLSFFLRRSPPPAMWPGFCFYLTRLTFEIYADLLTLLLLGWSYFRPLLFRKDPRGLLLAAYWFASLRQIDQWWLTVRARSECMAIVSYLTELQDPKIAALLAYPASFGQADISYIWDPPNSEPDSSTIFERYFQKSISRTPPRLHEISPTPDPCSAIDPGASK